YPQRGEMIFRQNVKLAAFFNEFAAKHPRKAPGVQKAPAVKKSKGELTDEQKARLANDEAAKVVFSKNKKTLVKYASCLGEREEWIQSGYPVPDFVTAIGVKAFAKVEGIQVKKVILPEGLTRIGRRAFIGCHEIETVVFPSTLKTIEEEAFQFCGLKELRLQEGTEHIGADAFRCCGELQKAILPDSLTGMEARVFGNCDNLTEVRLPAALKTIPQFTFAGCKKLEKIFIPDSVEKIEDFAFRSCPELCMVEVPEGIEVCGNAFLDSPKVKIVYRPVRKKQVK
ncbi:MAG: leucine-rich repeat domain-containing protein, partial [Lentisphaeria bacterium]|nr:leucine-rich repeat domain-containing protein [Lentisphaeria bacterium]